VCSWRLNLYASCLVKRAVSRALSRALEISVSRPLPGVRSFTVPLFFGLGEDATRACRTQLPGIKRALCVAFPIHNRTLKYSTRPRSLVRMVFLNPRKSLTEMAIIVIYCEDAGGGCNLASPIPPGQEVG